MGRKLALLGIVAAAFVVLALPAVASAAPQLYEGGTALGEEVELIGTSHNVRVANTAVGTIECENWEFGATTSENNSTTGIEAAGTEAETELECVSEGFPVHITHRHMLSWETRGNEHRGTVSWTFAIDIGPFISCHFHGTGSFTYTTGTDVMNIAGIELAADEICEPEEGHPVFEGDFTITTRNGTPISFVG